MDNIKRYHSEQLFKYIECSRGITVTELIDKTGISRQTIYNHLRTMDGIRKVKLMYYSYTFYHRYIKGTGKKKKYNKKHIKQVKDRIVKFIEENPNCTSRQIFCYIHGSGGLLNLRAYLNQLYKDGIVTRKLYKNKLYYKVE